MGRTLLGIDLDESPFGGIVERLLDEEDLEKLDARPDGGTDPDESGNRTETDEESGDRSPAWRDDTETDTPSPGGAGNGDDGDGWRDRLAALGSRLRPVLLAVAGLAVLVGVAVLLARRYGDRVVAALSERFRPGGDGDASRADDGDGTADAVRSTGDDGWSPDSRESDPESDGESDDDGGAAVPPDGDVGALVALAFLALVAALARKATEDPPRDPLADGPE